MTVRIHHPLPILAILSITSIGLAACWPFDFTTDPYFLAKACDDGSQDCIEGTGGAGGTTTTTTINPSCVPFNSSGPVPDDCGVFVSSSKGDDNNAGTKDKPFATIAKALGAKKGDPVYLCAETFTEAVQLGGGALVYGGLDCTTDWTYVGGTKRSELTALADEVPLRVGAKNSLEMYDVTIRAADAAQKGGSSIGLVAEAEADVMLWRSSVEAGSGANGADGEAFVDAATAGELGVDGAEACGQNVSGPEGPLNACGDTDSIGGTAGAGGVNSGAPGGPGDPFANDNAGSGENAMNVCQSGTEGAAGTVGEAGAGAGTLGTINASQLFTGVPGSDGKPGTPGQGGGGGGGAKGGMAPCTGQAGNGGASGGSGGSGGCGGLGGKGGQAGGASIAIVSLGATLTFSEVTITARAGGKGGNGGNGQPGGAGGDGGKGGTVPMGISLNPGCGGGKGGIGGGGGKGGGGRGGHSIAIAHTGAALATEGATLTTGTAGNPGAGEGAMGNGKPGVAAQVQKF